MVLPAQAVRWQASSYIFISWEVSSSNSIVCNAGVKRSLLSEGRLDAGKAANLFSASRRFRALASLAVAAHHGIVFLLLYLSLLHSSRRGWMFTELAAPDSSFAERLGGLVAWDFSDLMVCSWENSPIHLHIWGQPQTLPWWRPASIWSGTYWEGKHQSESSCALPHPHLGRAAINPAWSRQCTKEMHPAANTWRQQMQLHSNVARLHPGLAHQLETRGRELRSQPIVVGMVLLRCSFWPPVKPGLGQCRLLLQESTAGTAKGTTEKETPSKWGCLYARGQNFSLVWGLLSLIRWILVFHSSLRFCPKAEAFGYLELEF